MMAKPNPNYGNSKVIHIMGLILILAGIGTCFPALYYKWTQELLHPGLIIDVICPIPLIAAGIFLIVWGSWRLQQHTKKHKDLPL